jgi:hypothetical protein
MGGSGGGSGTAVPSVGLGCRVKRGQKTEKNSFFQFCYTTQGGSDQADIGFFWSIRLVGLGNGVASPPPPPCTNRLY